MATILMYARMGALALGVYTGAGNQAALEAMATTRVLEEAEFRAHHPVFHKCAHVEPSLQHPGCRLSVVAPCRRRARAPAHLGLWGSGGGSFVFSWRAP
jgi:hypothetical protein